MEVATTSDFIQLLEEEAAAIAENIEEVEVKYRDEQTDPPDLDLKFHYAWVMSKSHERSRRDFGIQLLNELLAAGRGGGGGGGGGGHRPFECHLALAQANLLAHRPAQGRPHAEMALRIRPDDVAAQKLHFHLRERAQADKLRDVGLLAGGVALAAGVLGLAIGALARGGSSGGKGR
ncbi:unnamed protein product [Heterosigma akashiwo]